MKIEYTPKGDAMYIKMNDNIIVSTKSITDSIIFDSGESGELVGIELLDASTFVDDLSQVVYENSHKAAPMDEEALKARRKAIAKARRAKKKKVSDS